MFKINDLIVIAYCKGEDVNPKMFYYFSSHFLSHNQKYTDISWYFMEFLLQLLWVLTCLSLMFWTLPQYWFEDMISLTFT